MFIVFLGMFILCAYSYILYLLGRIFRAWIEDWEKLLIKKNFPVVEAHFLQKYQGLVMYDPDLDTTFTVYVNL